MSIKRFLSFARTTGRQFDLSILSDAARSPITRALDEAANELAPNIHPNLSDAFQLYYTRFINADDLIKLARWNGVWADVGLGRNDPNLSRRSWAEIVRQNRPRLDIAAVFDLYKQGVINAADWLHRWELTGMSDTDRTWLETQRPVVDANLALDWFNRGWYNQAQLDEAVIRQFGNDPGIVANYHKMIVGVGVQRTSELYWLGYYNDAAVDTELQRAGLGTVGQRQALIEREIPFLPIECFQLYYRGEIPENALDQHLRARGLHNSPLLPNYKRAMRPMPGPADLIRFAVREVWDNNVVQRYGYDDDFPEPFRHFMQWQGMDWGEPFVGANGQLFPSVSWPKAYWRSHWQTIAPSQAYEMFHKFRPNRVGRYALEVPNLQPFTLDDVKTILKIADYPPAFRDWLAAAAYRPMRLVDLRNAFLADVINRDECKELLRDRGYAEPDAEISVKLYEKKKAGNPYVVIENVTAAYLKKSFSIRIENYRRGFEHRGSLVDSLRLMGFQESAANLIADVVGVEEKLRQMDNALKLLKKDYIDGIYGVVQVTAFMRQYGVVEEKIVAYIQEWDIDRSLTHRAATTADILKYVREGLLSVAEAKLRLLNLGWIEVDAVLALASAENAYLTSQAKAAHAAEVQAARRAAELQAVQLKLVRAQEAIQANLRRLTPVSVLKIWYVDGAVSDTYIIDRMHAMGYPDDVVQAYLLDWTPKREKKANAKGK